MRVSGDQRALAFTAFELCTAFSINPYLNPVMMMPIVDANQGWSPKQHHMLAHMFLSLTRQGVSTTGRYQPWIHKPYSTQA
jgi:hypothetical protein